MFIFNLGIKILIPATIGVWLVLFPLCTIWSSPHPASPKNPRAGLIISLLVSFKFFLISFLFLILISFLFLFLKYVFKTWQDLLKTLIILFPIIVLLVVFLWPIRKEE